MVSVFVQAIISGFGVWVGDAKIFVVIAACSFIPFGLCVMLVLFRLKIVEDLTALISGALCGGLLLDVFLSLLIVWLSPPGWSRALFWGTVLLIWGLDFFLWVRWRFRPQLDFSVGGLLLIIPILILIRLAFVANLTLPMYTDSVEHYTIIQDLSTAATPPQSYYNIAAFPQVIYHYGYHSLVAKLLTMEQVNLGRLMLDFGQLMLVIGVIGVYLPVYLATNKRLAGWVALLSAGFFWSMPAYAVNWGKYPAITAYALLPFVLGMMVFIGKQNSSKIENLVLVLLVVSVTSLFFVHTRMIIVLLLVIITVLITYLPKWETKQLSMVSIALVLVISALIVFQMVTVNPSVEIYWRFGKVPLFVAFVMSVISAVTYPRMTMACLVFLCLSLLAVNIHLPMGLEKYDAMIDRPFFQTGLYVLLSFLVATGVTGLAQQKYWGNKSKTPAFLAIGLCLILFGIASNTGVLFPSECCNLAREEDLLAYEWIRVNTDPADLFLISAIPDGLNLVPVDGGAWVNILTTRPVVKMAYTNGLSKPVNIEELCRQKIRFIYDGSFPRSFQLADLPVYPNQLLHRLNLQTVNIYEVDCND